MDTASKKKQKRDAKGKLVNQDDRKETNTSLQATRILREYWGPSSGKYKQTQRLFLVELSNGAKETLLAEDTCDPLPKSIQDVPFERNIFYAQVLETWRKDAAHHNPPARPVSDQGSKRKRG
jgi:hypothetical protein